MFMHASGFGRALPSAGQNPASAYRAPRNFWSTVSHFLLLTVDSPLRRLERVFRCTRARNLHQDAHVS